MPWLRPFEYAEAGRSLDEFFADHPEVDRAQVIQFVESVCRHSEKERSEERRDRNAIRQGKLPKWQAARERAHCCLVGDECPHAVGIDTAKFVREAAP